MILIVMITRKKILFLVVMTKNRNSPPPLDFFCLKKIYFPYKGKSLISNYPSKQNNGTSTPSGIKITFSFKDYMDFF